MKTILWFCNRPIEEEADRRDGTWFTAMAKEVAGSEKIRLSVIAQATV